MEHDPTHDMEQDPHEATSTHISQEAEVEGEHANSAFQFKDMSHA